MRIKFLFLIQFYNEIKKFKINFILDDSEDSFF